MTWERDVANEHARRGAAATIVAALATSTNWVHRQRETVTLADRTAARRQLVVEFSIPQTVQTDVQRSDLAVPLGFVAREQTQLLSAIDETGARVPVLTAAEAGELAHDMLVVLAEGLARENEFDVPQRVVLALRAIVSGGHRDLGPLRDLVEADAATADSTSRAAQALLAYEPFVQLARTVASSYPLVVTLNPSGPARRILILTFETSFTTTSRWRQRLSASLGWSVTNLYFAPTSVGFARAYEFEFEVPAGLEVSDADWYNVERRDAETPFAAPAVFTSIGSRFARLTLTGTSRADVALVLLSLRIARGYAWSVLVAALVPAVATTAGFVRLSELASAPDASIALLLAVPTLLAASVAQFGRGGPAIGLVATSRAILLISGLVTFVAAFGLVLFPPNLLVGHRAMPGPVLTSLWRVATYVSWVLVALQVPGAVGPTFQLRLRRRRQRART